MTRALPTEWLWRRASPYLCCAIVIAGTMLGAAGIALGQSGPIKGSAALTPQDGFARLILTLDDDSEPEVTAAGNVLVVRFKRKAEIALDGIVGAVPDYVGTARRDPDGMAIRFALRRKVTLNAMSASERTYIDLLPENWSGPPPGLPADVVRQLAERTRAAERALRQHQGSTAPKPRAQVRMRASQQAQLLRFSFDLPQGVTASSAIADRKLTVIFDAPLDLDLTDARTIPSARISAITPNIDVAASTIEMSLVGGDSELRAFIEDKNYIVDLVTKPVDVVQQIERTAAPPSQPKPQSPSETEPAKIEPAQIEPLKSEAAKPEPLKNEAAVPAGDAAAASAQAIASLFKQKPVAASRAATPPAVAEKSPQPDGTFAPQLTRDSDALRIGLPVPSSIPVALFRRADKVWLVIDQERAIETAEIVRASNGLITEAQVVRLDRASAVRIRLKRPLLPSLSQGEQGWTVALAEMAPPSQQQINVVRNISDPRRATVTVTLPGAGRLHRLVDPDDGETLHVVTALPPVRAVVRRQGFVEFSLLETVHSLAIESGVDDLAIDVTSQRVVLDRPGGLILSTSAGAVRAGLQPGVLFDLKEWQEDQQSKFAERLGTLMVALANAGPSDRAIVRVDIARFYIARGFYAEAKGVLDPLIDAEATRENPTILTLHALGSTLAGFPALALKDIAKLPADAATERSLWTALALAQQRKWAPARENFHKAAPAIGILPIDLQRVALHLYALVALEAGDISEAASRVSELDLLGVAEEMKPTLSVLRGRIAQALGRDDDALLEYGAAAASSHRQASTEGRLHEIALRAKRGEPVTDTMLRDLETLAVTWRGDGIELRALQMLVKSYGANGRYQEALEASRSATRLQPNSDVARQLQDDAAELFTQLYLTSKGNAVPPIEALATFYEYPELTPIGRRGDELIRRLADRLVAVDLLDQAGELLQYQMENRLEGAARAQVAAKLATIYLMNRKPQRAIAALQSSRLAELSGELRQERLLLEARAQSDIGRRELALDIITNVGGKEAVRLRSDIHWAARRWREASEQIELYLGDRWRDFTPLTPIEKSDVLRAAIGYALADDSLGQARFREKFGPLMSSAEDSAMMQIASQPNSARPTDLAQVAKLAASVDTLDGFVRDMKARFQEAARGKANGDGEITGSLLRIVGSKTAAR